MSSPHLVFLDVNGIGDLPAPGELADVTLRVASGQLAKAELAAWFERQLS